MAQLTHWRRQLKSDLIANRTVGEVVSPQVIEPGCRESGHRWRASFWSPTTTLIDHVPATGAVSGEDASGRGRRSPNAVGGEGPYESSLL